MIKKTVSIFLLITIIGLGFIYKNNLVEIVKQGGVYAVLMGMLLVAIVVFFPVIPFPILAGIIGAVFGLWKGTAITLSGAMIGTILMFFIVRYGFREEAQKKLENYPKIKEYEEKFESNPFLTIFLVRLIPIVPAPVVNILSSLSNIKWSVFFFASLLGKIPNNVIMNFVGAHFKDSKMVSIGTYVVYMIIIAIAVQIYQNKQKKEG